MGRISNFQILTEQVGKALDDAYAALGIEYSRPSLFRRSLNLISSTLTAIKCKVGIHSYPSRWSKREKHIGAFEGEVYYQFKTCPNCGAETSREV